ncbi:MAG: IS66 family transposase zinc-finger binding domain-containing protein [Oceanospirillaceae bacterium]
MYDLTDAEKFCPHDGTALSLIGHDQHEQLDIIPAKVKVLRHLCQKYACPCCKIYMVSAKKQQVKGKSERADQVLSLIQQL